MAQRYLIAHDVGTRSCKTLLIAPPAQIVARAIAPYAMEQPAPGRAEQDPAVWWQAICRTTHEVLAHAGIAPDQIAAVTFTTQMLGIVPVSATGDVLRPAILWLDGRAQREADALMRRLGGRRAFALAAGAVATGKDVVPKLHWLRSHEPGILNHATGLLDVQGYLLMRCAGGQPAIDWSAASATGLLDLRTRRWSRLLARAVGVPLAKFPVPCAAGTIIGRLRAAAARDLGLTPETFVVCGSGDIPTAAIGAGATRPGAIHLYLGTSGWVGVATDRLTLRQRGVPTIHSATSGSYLRLAETEAAGACVQWLAESLWDRSDPDVFAAIDAAVSTIRPGADGLLYTPWLFGERAPIDDVYARAAFVNLHAHHTRAHMARAVYEGVALNLRWIVEQMRRIGAIDGLPLRVVGGGAQSDVWMQIIADTTGCVVERVAHARDAGAIGAGLLAAESLGYADGYVVAIERRFEPDPAHRRVYDRQFALYRQLYRALRPVFRRLNRGADR